MRRLYVGHGPPAVTELLADQRRYLLMVREAIGGPSGLGELSEQEANGVTRLMERYLPGAPLSWLIGAGAAAVAAELALANNDKGDKT